MELVLLTDKNRFFGQTRKPWVSIDTEAFVQYLLDYGLKVKEYEFHRLVNSTKTITNTNIFYTFSQKENLRNYILDVMFYLNEIGNNIIPSLELLKCHENKGFQELYKKSIGLDQFKSFYFSSIDELKEYSIDYPIVIKTIDGSNGKGVFLCKSIDEIEKKIGRFSTLPFDEKIDLFRRKYLRERKVIQEYPNYSNKQDYLEYKDYITPKLRFIAQEFIPNQRNDFRVLAIEDRYFVIKRHNRNNDFRASGSKLFDSNFDADENLLNTAKYIKSIIVGTPYLSMDFIFDERDNKYYLLEFQALHFGVSAILKNDGYYANNNGNWKKNVCKTTFEEQLAWGLFNYLKRQDGI